MEKLLRTLQVNFPYLLDTKFAVKSLVSRVMRRPQERDFHALSLFPDIHGALYLDVGANRGQSTEAILMLTRNSSVLAFEPNLLLCDKIARKFRDNKRVAVDAFGLGNQDGRFTLYVPFYKAWMYDGLASLKRDSASDWLKGRVFFFRERHLTVKELECSIKRLDDLHLAPFFIKLDIQGYEYEALCGGQKTLAAHEPVLLIESPDETTIDMLRQLGYRSYRFQDGGFVPDVLGSPNTFFMTGSKAALVGAAHSGQ